MVGRNLAILAAAALGVGFPAAAEPIVAEAPLREAPNVGPKAELNPAELDLQLAQRSEIKTPAVAPKRPRVGRASSCRCGDLASQQR